MGKAHKSSYNKHPNICSDIEVYRFGVTLQVCPNFAEHSRAGREPGPLPNSRMALEIIRKKLEAGAGSFETLIILKFFICVMSTSVCTPVWVS